jgi:hypothetical protein
MKTWFRKHQKLTITLLSLLVVLVGLFTASAIYVSDYYHADASVAACMTCSDTVSSETRSDGSIVFRPKEVKAGFIFYPGGKVEYTAYAPLMQACAQKGILCVLVKMPFNLAVLHLNAADGIKADYSEVEHWYIGGHSLGGAMAAYYAADHASDFDGLVLLGAYSTKDLSSSGLKVLSVYGSEDGVLNREKYQENKKNLPEDAVEQVIDGGCHGGFGSYGTQKGDGVPTISSTEQIAVTAENILKLVESQTTSQ